ncbi:MAG: hypothetical protein QW520_06810 [Methanomassiliicoccales archaeon]
MVRLKIPNRRGVGTILDAWLFLVTIIGLSYFITFSGIIQSSYENENFISNQIIERVTKAHRVLLITTVEREGLELCIPEFFNLSEQGNWSLPGDIELIAQTILNNLLGPDYKYLWEIVLKDVRYKLPSSDEIKEIGSTVFCSSLKYPAGGEQDLTSLLLVWSIL